MNLSIHRIAVAGMMVVVMAFSAVAATFASQPNTTGGQAPVASTALPKDKDKSEDKKAKKAKKKSRAPWMHRVNGKLVVKPKSLAWHINKKWFGVKHWWALNKLIIRESSWNPWDVNSSSGACGLPQALPCSKIPNWRSIKSQLIWMMRYIKGRYGNPTSALYAHYAKGWY